MMDELGYDVELTYRKKAAEWGCDNSGFMGGNSMEKLYDRVDIYDLIESKERFEILKNEYLLGGVTYRELSEKYAISLDRIKKAASRGRAIFPS